jgi:hypothetical protein
MTDRNIGLPYEPYIRIIRRRQVTRRSAWPFMVDTRIAKNVVQEVPFKELPCKPEPMLLLTYQPHQKAA